MFRRTLETVARIWKAVLDHVNASGRCKSLDTAQAFSVSVWKGLATDTDGGRKHHPCDFTGTYPHSEHQLCIVHQIRNSLKFVSYKDRKQVGKDLKPIYQAVTEEEALDALKSFEASGENNILKIAKSWYNNWEHLIAFLKYPQCIRKVIYTTNAIESLNNQLRKVTRNKRVFQTMTQYLSPSI